MYHCYHYFRHGHVGTSHKNRSQGDIAPTQVSLLIHPIQITLYSDSSAPEMNTHMKLVDSPCMWTGQSLQMPP